MAAQVEMDAHVVFGEGYCGPWPCTQHVEVHVDDLVLRPGAQPTTLVRVVDAEGNSISGTPHDMRRLANVLLGLTRALTRDRGAGDTLTVGIERGENP